MNDYDAAGLRSGENFYAMFFCGNPLRQMFYGETALTLPVRYGSINLAVIGPVLAV